MIRHMSLYTVYVVGMSMYTFLPTASLSSTTVCDDSFNASIIFQATRLSHRSVACRSHATSPHSMN